MESKRKRKADKNDKPDDTCRKKKNSSSSSSSKDTSNLSLNETDDTQLSAGSYLRLPQEILLQIFKELNIKEICSMARVCKDWCHACYDDSNWTHLDLSNLNLNLKQLWKLFRHRCFIKVKSLKLCGNLRDFQSIKLRQPISKALMTKLKQTCINLDKLEIMYSDLNALEVNDLPESIHDLRLKRCEIPIKWFEKNNLKNLTYLDVSGSSRICSNHLQDISNNCKSTLKTLKLKSCYRIDDKAIEILVNEKFNSLMCLDLEETLITQYGLQLINSYLLDKLIYLNLKKCVNLKPVDIQFIKLKLSQNQLLFKLEV